MAKYYNSSSKGGFLYLECKLDIYFAMKKLERSVFISERRWSPRPTIRGEDTKNIKT